MRLTLLLLAFLICSTANAQNSSFGVDISSALQQFKESPTGLDNTQNLSLSSGIVADIHITGSASFLTGANFDYNRIEFESGDFRSESNIYYVNVPTQIKADFNYKADAGFYIAMGIDTHILLAADGKAIQASSGNTVASGDISSDLHDIRTGMLLSAGYRFTSPIGEFWLQSDIGIGIREPYITTESQLYNYRLKLSYMLF